METDQQRGPEDSGITCHNYIFTVKDGCPEVNALATCDHIVRFRSHDSVSVVRIEGTVNC